MNDRPNLIVVCAEQRIVDVIRAGARNARVFGPGAAVAGWQFKINELVTQPGWEPTEKEREWVAHHVYPRFGPADFPRAVVALERFLPERMTS